METKLATAMEARGFGSDAPRSQARESKLHAVDWLFYAICIAVPAIALATAYYTGYWHWAFSNVQLMDDDSPNRQLSKKPLVIRSIGIV